MSDRGDLIDRANDHAQAMLDAQIAGARKPIEPGEPGECDRCGEYSPRLVHGNCAKCRDKYSLP